MAKCECCGAKEATAAILEWADDPIYGVSDLKEAVISYECFPHASVLPVDIIEMGKRIRARRLPKILPETLPVGTRAAFLGGIFVAMSELVRKGACNAYSGKWKCEGRANAPGYMWAEQILWTDMWPEQIYEKPAEPQVNAERPAEPVYNGSNLELDSEIAMKMGAHPNHRKPYFRPEPKAKPAVVHVWQEHWSTPTWES